MTDTATPRTEMSDDDWNRLIDTLYGALHSNWSGDQTSTGQLLHAAITMVAPESWTKGTYVRWDS